MLKKTGWLSAGLTLAAFSAVASFALGGVGSAQAAVVYCKTVGVPKGCVARPTPVAVVATPGRRRRRCRASVLRRRRPPRHADEPRWSVSIALAAAEPKRFQAKPRRFAKRKRANWKVRS
jgi:hypothetical protein